MPSKLDKVSSKRVAYTFLNQWDNFVMDSDEEVVKILPTHHSLYFALIRQNNDYNWKENFPAPTSYMMKRSGINSVNTFQKIFNDLVQWGFVKIIKNSTNQHNAKVVALSIFDIADDIAIDIAADNNALLPTQKMTGQMSEQVISYTNYKTLNLNTKTIKGDIEAPPDFNFLFSVFKKISDGLDDWNDERCREKAKKFAEVYKGSFHQIDINHQVEHWIKTEFVARPSEAKKSNFPDKWDRNFYDSIRNDRVKQDYVAHVSAVSGGRLDFNAQGYPVWKHAT